MSSVVISGNTSGSVTLDAPAVAGSTVLTLPATSGTVVTTATTTGISGSAITTGTVGVSVGGTGANTLTANNVILGNGTSAVQFVAPGSSGNVLTSNGTIWQSTAAPAAMTLLGTITPTAVNSVSLSGLTLTDYKFVYITFSSAVSNNTRCYISSNNIQTGGGVLCTAGEYIAGTAFIDLTSGSVSGALSEDSVTPIDISGTTSLISARGTTNVLTTTTEIYFRLGSTSVWSATGSILVYGVK